MFKSIRWLFGYSMFAVAGGYLTVRILEAVASPFLEATSLTRRKQSSSSGRARR